ncbi:MAG: hypothetical protein OXM61_07780 [Candidatus Poribacteria bacterium]|nr:hypothetical protein [Candidatus Poribacteria bacterium]
MTKTIDKVSRTTTPNEERLNQLKQLFPECLTEGEVDTAKVIEQLNVCKVGGLLMNSTNVTASPGPAKMMLFASLTYPPRLH